MASGMLYNLARMTTTTNGTGTITLGSAVTGFLSFSSAGVTDGVIVSYAIEDGSNREVGTGTYTAAGTTLTRTVVNSTNGGSAISLSGSAQVFITALAADIVRRQLYDNTASGAIASWDVTSIPQTYNNLELVLYARGDGAASNITVSVRFNNDSAANYDNQSIQGNQAATQATGVEAGTSAGVADIPGSTAPATHSGLTLIDIPSYTATTFFKNGTSRGGSRCVAASTFLSQDRFIQWRSTAAINRITVLPSSGNFITGSRFSIYGVI